MCIILYGIPELTKFDRTKKYVCMYRDIHKYLLNINCLVAMLQNNSVIFIIKLAEGFVK